MELVWSIIVTTIICKNIRFRKIVVSFLNMQVLLFDDTQTLKLASQNVEIWLDSDARVAMWVSTVCFGRRPSGFNHFSNVKFEFGCFPDPFRTLHPTSVFRWKLTISFTLSHFCQFATHSSRYSSRTTESILVILCF
jgi:hypothetical protein